MVGPDFFDGFLLSGLVPGMRPVTISSPDAGRVTFPADARKEPASFDQMAAAGIEVGTEACVFWVPAGQDGFVRPGIRWGLVDSDDGRAWTIQKADVTIQERGWNLTCSAVN